ncbi:hypothetical protein STEG23_009030 [Scotinomys teguina]
MDAPKLQRNFEWLSRQPDDSVISRILEVVYNALPVYLGYLLLTFAERGQISSTEPVMKHQTTTLKCQWNSKGSLLFLQFALDVWFREHTAILTCVPNSILVTLEIPSYCNVYKLFLAFLKDSISVYVQRDNMRSPTLRMMEFNYVLLQRLSLNIEFVVSALLIGHQAPDICLSLFHSTEVIDATVMSAVKVILKCSSNCWNGKQVSSFLEEIKNGDSTQYFIVSEA